MKIAFFDAKSYDMPGFDHYAENTGIKIKYFEARLNEDTASLAAGYDAVCVFVNDDVNAAVVNKLHELGIKMIALRCAGFNNVDLKACEGKIRVFRVPAYSPYAVAEHAMAMFLTINRRIHKAYIRTKEFNFSLNGLAGFDMHGKTVGIIGTGKIGRIFADICRGFGMNILAYDKFPAPNSGLNYVDLPELFSKSDIISLHCPMTPDTYHLINEKTIGMMKKGVNIINTSRGGLIDSEALIEGIKNKKVGSACLDVYEAEGNMFYNDNSGHIMQDDDLARLISMPNVIITSHQAFLTEEALDNIASTSIDNMLKFEAGTPNTQNEVLPEEAQKTEYLLNSAPPGKIRVGRFVIQNQKKACCKIENCCHNGEDDRLRKEGGA